MIFDKSIHPSELDKSIHYFQVDITDNEALKLFVEKAVNDIGKPSLLINSAGILNAGTIMEQSDFLFREVINVNLIGQKNMVKACLPHMSRGAHIVFISSLAGIVGNYAYCAYAASKFAVIGLAECLRIELKEKGIDVSVICPGEVITPMVQEERKTMNPITAKLKEFPGSLSTESAVKMMLTGIDKRKFRIIPGFMPQVTTFLSIFIPWFARWVVDTKVKNVIKILSLKK